MSKETRTIHKYVISQHGETTITLPWHSEVIHFAEMAEGELCIWLEAPVKTNFARGAVDHTYMIVGIGWEYDDDWNPQKTVVDSDGFVWHLLLKD
tara:strand:- start:698 stop:982 length:285 start_codon:yes stop_codon:yes gene_type:complete